MCKGAAVCEIGWHQAAEDIGENMKRFLLAVIALTLLSAGGIYFAAETVILPKQEKIWRDLLEDLPYGLEADFEDVEFERVGLRLSIGGATIGDGSGSTVKISEIVAENSLSTALGNLVRFVLGKEEERYDTVRFIGVEPQQPEMGVNLEIQEVRLLDVAIGIDNKLPSTIKALTGAINLEKAFSAAKVGGYEIHGASADAQGIIGRLDMMKVHGITKTSIGLVEVSGLKVRQGAQSLVSLEMFRTTNFNIASMMEPGAAMNILGVDTPEAEGAATEGSLADLNIFHLADEFVIRGLETGVPGLGGLSIQRMMYQEEEAEFVDNVGIVATRTYSDIRDFSVQFPGLAMVSRDLAVFMDTTGINALEFNGRGDNNWDLSTGDYLVSDISEFTDLVRFSTDLQLGTLFPEDIVNAMAWSQGMTTVEAGGLTTAHIAQAFMSGQDAYGAISLVNFVFLIEDKSLVERLYRYAEVALGMPEADLKAMIDGELKSVQDDPALNASLVDDVAAIRAFVQDPVSLRIALQPPVIVSVNELVAEEDSDKVLDMLGLTITANGGL